MNRHSNRHSLALFAFATLLTGAAVAAGADDAQRTLSPAAAAYLNLDLASIPADVEPALPPYYGPERRHEGGFVHDDTPAYNRTTGIGAALGRVLFYDKHLSVNDSIACASCHVQKNGFTDEARFSTGFTGSVFGTAHAMRLGNVRYDGTGTMFWDRRADSLEDQALQPIQNPIEMGYDDAHGGLTALVAVLETLPYYPELFADAFGDPDITPTRISYALAQFERTLVTTNSAWDQGYARVYDPNARPRNFDVPLPNFTAQQNRGLHLFMGAVADGGMNCAGCHRPPSFALSASVGTNGLDPGETIYFKAPSLKNVAVLGHYMHDGRFTTLAQVVAHYSDGIQAGPSLDARLLNRAGQPVRFHLSAADQAALVAFLQTLTDPSFLSDPRFASPFKDRPAR
jgi:cytochrome c peroxidase